MNLIIKKLGNLKMIELYAIFKLPSSKFLMFIQQASKMH